MTPPGVNVLGQFHAESGVGEAARNVVAALDAAGVPVLPVLPLEQSPSRQGVEFGVVPMEQATFPVTLSLLTAFETPPFVAAAPRSFLRGRRFVGLWWWELDEFPDFMAAAFAHVDAVWAGTTHVQRALLSGAGNVPVDLVRYPVRAPEPTGASRSEFGLPAEAVVFTTVFGYYSGVARKNPEGTIEAFCRAFPAPVSGGPQLVVKTIDDDAHPEEHRALSALAGGRPDIHLLAGYMDRAEMDRLFAVTDVVISLHRAEGFGYAPAEAMALGVPAIATGYSGNLEYMTPENSVLIDAELVRVGANGGVYSPDSLWAEPDLGQAAAAMRRLAADANERAAIGARAAADMARDFSVERAGESMLEALSSLPPATGLTGRLSTWKSVRRAAALARSR